ncbi:FAD/NAD-P-binding domain-containing protein [Trametes punicea]|nr:FAD/NAD-P-binding domain-containing protein [Trametes punicea]
MKMPDNGLSYSSQSTPGTSAFPIGDFCIDDSRLTKVLIVGAGFSGITAGIRFQQKLPDVGLTIYEKSAGVGGVWFNNKYPGLTCDVPSHSYQLTFEQKKDWSALYAPGPEIRQYLEDVVEKYKLTRYLKLKHEVVHAQYNEAAGRWHVRVRRQNAETGGLDELEDTADVLVCAMGSLSRWNWPDIEGLQEFKGTLYHSASFDPAEKTWQEVVEGWKDKRVGVIGVGSSALQLVATLQPRVKKVVNYVRGKTWFSGPFLVEAFQELLGRDPEVAGSYEFTSEELERLKNDPEFYQKFRMTLDTALMSMHPLTKPDSLMQLGAQEGLRRYLQQKLEKKPWIYEKLNPDYSVVCRRLTPGPGYLEALCSDSADFVSTTIRRITESGIETIDGEYQDLDIIFCATGYDASYRLPMKILGRNGVDLNDKWTPHPVTYLSIAVDSFPNMFLLLGPNSNIATGSILANMEAQVKYAVQATAKLQRERLKSIEAKPEAVRDFDQYLETYFSKTVHVEKCRSWYKGGKEDGRVVGLWPGSTLHALRTLANPRWEDSNYERLDPVENRFYWLGDGQTNAEKTLTGDRVWYLREPWLDAPSVPATSELHGVPQASKPP